MLYFVSIVSCICKQTMHRNTPQMLNEKFLDQSFPITSFSLYKAMFTLYRIVKRSVTESVPDRASVHIRNAAFEAVSAPEQYCSAPLLKVERSVSDRFLRRSESSLNTFIAAEIATEPRIGKLSFQIKRERCKLHNGEGFCSHWERFGTISAPQQNINSCSHCTGATFETEQKPIRYSVNIA